LIALVETGVLKLHRKGDAWNPLGGALAAKYGLEQWEEAFDAADKAGANGNVVFEI
jgi:hypothetical protein